MIHTHSFLVPFKPLLPHALQMIFGQWREKLALLEQELAELALPELLPSRLRLWDPAPLLPFLPHRGGLSRRPAVAPASAPLLALGGCPTAHGSWASDPCWTERTVRALAQLELKMASVITNYLLTYAAYLLTLFTYSLTHLLTYSPTHSLTYLLKYSA